MLATGDDNLSLRCLPPDYIYRVPFLTSLVSSSLGLWMSGYSFLEDVLLAIYRTLFLLTVVCPPLWASQSRVVCEDSMLMCPACPDWPLTVATNYNPSCGPWSVAPK